MSSRSKWEDEYRKRYMTMWYPYQSIVRFVAKHIQRKVDLDKFNVNKKVETALDGGCGNGRYVVFLAEQGFDVFGVDISEEALKIAEK